METEHEKLKWICEKIGYMDWIKEFCYIESEGIFFRIEPKLFTTKANVREIIFTQEFMDKFYNYIEDLSPGYFEFCGGLLENLDTPVDYLLTLIK